MYHHLALTANHGLFKSWLLLLSQVSQREYDKPLRRVILELSQEIFETLNWEAWSLKPSRAKQKTELIGQDRKVII